MSSAAKNTHAKTSSPQPLSFPGRAQRCRHPSIAQAQVLLPRVSCEVEDGCPRRTRTPKHGEGGDMVFS